MKEKKKSIFFAYREKIGLSFRPLLIAPFFPLNYVYISRYQRAAGKVKFKTFDDGCARFVSRPLHIVMSCISLYGSFRFGSFVDGTEEAV